MARTTMFFFMQTFYQNRLQIGTRKMKPKLSAASNPIYNAELPISHGQELQPSEELHA
jgi:hypothetical protein